MSLELRIKEEPDPEPDQDVTGQVLPEHQVVVYIKQETPWSGSEGADVKPAGPPSLAGNERVARIQTLQQSNTVDASGVPDDATVRVKRVLIDQEAVLTQELSPDVVCQIKVERIDETAGEGREMERPVVEQGGHTSPAVKVVDPAEAARSEVRDDSAAKAENEDTSTRIPKKRQPGPHLCDVCNKEFKKSNKLLIHKRTHTGEKPYKCSICHKQFSYSNGLKVHVRTHTGDKPHVCRTCNKRFVQWSSLKAHERIHTGEKPYSCEICKKEFSQLNNLNKHQLVHSEIRQYSCEICKKEFKDINSLRRHEPIHVDDKKILCGKCKKHFATARHLRDHERAHTRKRRRYPSRTS